ncbi:MAG: hypothetical protein OXC18_18495 [Desulfurellaceae bacterium]|nr:hypothetical protein [Desulfurellaceae bacterium]
MLTRSRFIKELHLCGYTHQKGKETSRTLLYKKKGSRDNIFVPQRAELSEEFVRRVLQREGYSPKKIADIFQES